MWISDQTKAQTADPEMAHRCGHCPGRDRFRRAQNACSPDPALSRLPAAAETLAAAVRYGADRTTGAASSGTIHRGFSGAGARGDTRDARPRRAARASDGTRSRGVGVDPEAQGQVTD